MNTTMSSATPSLMEVQVLHMQGASLCEKGNWKEAAELFSLTLSRLSCCALSPTPIGNEDKFFTAADVYILGHGLLEAKKQEFLSCPFAFEFLGFDENDREYDDCWFTSEEHSVATICALFNLGVCFHSEWKNCAQERTSLLLKALHCYEQALSMFRSSCYSNTSAHDPVLKVLMGVCSNATHCHIELGKLDLVSLWNATLCSFLNFSRCSCCSLEDENIRDSSPCPMQVDCEEKEVDGDQNDDDSDDDGIAEREDCLYHYFTMQAFFNKFQRVAAHAA